MRTNPQHRRSSFSLVEMMAAMTVLSILVVGVGSTLVIASRAVDDGTAVNAQVPEARDVADVIVADISDALTITERTATAIEFSVPDRDNDGNDELLRYAWDGKQGGSVTRQYNKGPVVAIAEDVHSFDITYLTRTVKPPPQACCYVDGTCADESPDDCSSNGGLAKGKYTDCASSDCIGACCMEGGGCIDATELACNSRVGDTYQGDGSRCADVKCASGLEILFVVVDEGNLTIQEEYRKSLFETWGNTVALINSDESQANYDTALESAEVVYVSEEIVSSEIGTKLTNTTVGVVNEERALADELGIAQNGTAVTETNITILNSAHYITESFTTSSIAIVSSSQDNTAMNLDLASGLQVLANQDGYPSLAVLETGATLYEGGPAAGRRVQLPWAGNDFDFSALSDDGKIILKRSLVWAAGNDPVPNPILHYDFENQSGTTVTDRIGDVDLTLYPNGSAITWVDNSGGAGLFFDQDGTSGQASARTQSAGDADSLRDALQATDQLTVQVLLIAEAFESRFGRVITYSRDTGKLRNFTIAGEEISETMAKMYGRIKNSSNYDQFAQTGTIPLNTLTVLTFGVDLTATTENIKLYVDGSVVTTGSSNGDFNEWTSERLLLGNEGTLDRPMRGTIYDVKIWDRALSENHVNELAQTLLSLTTCGNGTCEPGENPCNCATDCGPETLNEQVTFNCADGIDNDCDGYADCTDADCTTDASCLVVCGDDKCDGTETACNCAADCGAAVASEAGDALCGDSLDNDCDGQTDCADSECTNAAPCTPYCGDGSCNGSETPCTCSADCGAAPVSESTCDDSEDNDCDGDTDCDDSDCDGDAACVPPCECDGNYVDDFEDGFDGNEGSLEFPDHWIEVGESDGAKNGDVKVLNKHGSYRLRLKDNDNGGEGVKRGVPLCPGQNASLNLIYRREKLDGKDDYVKLEISSTGSGGPWTELDRFAGPDNDSGYEPYSNNISDHATQDTWIRLITSPSMGKNDAVYIDDVIITCSP